MFFAVKDAEDVKNIHMILTLTFYFKLHITDTRKLLMLRHNKWMKKK